MPVPYIVGLPIKDPSDFYGFRELVARFYDLVGGRQAHSVSIRGLKRSGKTSLLYYLGHPSVLAQYVPNPAAYVPFYVDFSTCNSPAKFYNQVYHGLLHRLVSAPAPEYERVVEPDAADIIWLLGQFPDRRFLLFLDEFDRLTWGAFDETFLSQLRALAGARDTDLALITASFKSLDHIGGSLGLPSTSPFYNIFFASSLYLSGLRKAEATDLIRHPAEQEGLIFTDEEVEAIQEMAGTLPFLLQMSACKWFLVKQHGRSLLRNDIQEELVIEASPFFESWLRDLEQENCSVLDQIAEAEYDPRATFQTQEHQDSLRFLKNFGFVIEEQGALRLNGLVMATWIRRKNTKQLYSPGPYSSLVEPSPSIVGSENAMDPTRTHDKVRSSETSLKGLQLGELSEVLRKGFSKQRLSEILLYKLNRNLEDISLGGDLREVVFDVIKTAEAESWINQLILAAREANPGNVLLYEFSQYVGLTATDASCQELERIIHQSNGFLDVNVWREKLGIIENQVCRIEIATNAGMVFGTGFLVAKDLILTNYHVIEPLISGKTNQMESQSLKAEPSNVVFRFDYKRLPDGIIQKGTEYRLKTTGDGYLVDSSPNGSSNLLPALDQLDYAFLRVDSEPANDAIGGRGGALRGFVQVMRRQYQFPSNSALFIMQHPQAAPLKLAVDTDSIIGINENRTRVRYKTNTDPGSSGSPCFNSNWELVALHHSGDPNFKPTYNEGIPMDAIVNLLQQRGKENILGQ